MERLVAKLERALGRYVPHGLPLWIVALSGLGYLAVFAKPEVYNQLVLWGPAVASEPWRLVTFLFAPLMPVRQPLDLLWVAFALQIAYMFMSGLESQWGSFRFVLYWLIGALGAIAAGLITGFGTAKYLDISLLLAFATLFPDVELLLFFILPVKVKWLGFLGGAYLVWDLATGSMASRVAIVAGVLNFLLFCGPALLGSIRRRPRRRPATAAFAPEPARKLRVCAKCGRSEAEDPNLEFRVCDCQEKCGGRLTDYCIDHARNH